MELSEEAQSRIKRQVEFYFSDSNLPRDRFLRGKTEENEQGFVNLKVLCSFSRMAAILDVSDTAATNLSDALLEKVAEVLKPSESLVLSEDGKQVRRKDPLPPSDQLVKQVDERSLYATPFPQDVELDTLQAFFSGVAPTNAVRMRRHLKSKEFRGSIFVEFKDIETAKQVLEKGVEYEGAPLRMMPKLEYIAKKAAERKENGGPASPDPQDDSPKQGRKRKAEGDAPKDEDEDGNGAGPADEDYVSDEPETFKYENGHILAFSFAEDAELPESLDFTKVKEAFGGKSGGVAYVEYQQGDKGGVVRFATKERSYELLKQTKKEPFIIDAVEAQVRMLEGADEEAFYKRAAISRKARDDAFSYKKGFRGRGRGRGRGGGRGRGFARGRARGRRGRS